MRRFGERVNENWTGEFTQYSRLREELNQALAQRDRLAQQLADDHLKLASRPGGFVGITMKPEYWVEFSGGDS